MGDKSQAMAKPVCEVRTIALLNNVVSGHFVIFSVEQTGPQSLSSHFVGGKHDLIDFTHLLGWRFSRHKRRTGDVAAVAIFKNSTEVHDHGLPSFQSSCSC